MAFHRVCSVEKLSTMVKAVFCVVVFTLVFYGCTKKSDNEFRDYFKVKVDGKKESLNACAGFLSGGTGGGDWRCDIQGDTVLFLVVGCETKAGFYLNERISNGTYQLSKNNAWYDSAPTGIYKTSNDHRGSLILEKGIFQAPGGGTINTLKGKFSFDAFDSTSGKTVRITEGEFFMECYY